MITYNQCMQIISDICSKCQYVNCCQEDVCPLYKMENNLTYKNKCREYKVRVIAKFSQNLIINAESKDDAKNTVLKMLEDEEITFDVNNFTETKIEVKNG